MNSPLKLFSDSPKLLKSLCHSYLWTNVEMKSRITLYEKISIDCKITT